MRNKVTPAPPHQTNKQQVIKVNAKNYHSITDFIWCDDGKEGAPAIDLTWLKRTTDAPDLGVGVTITPDRKVVTKFGWEWAGVKKVYLDVVGNNPWIGDYKLSRKGEFEEISGSTYKMKWTGHGETTNGFLRRVSPVETNVMTSINTRNLHVDAVVWKSFAGKKYGFTLTNDKFLLLAGN